jgi:uncharacterized protein YecT (DUF1311 family)
MRKLLLILVLLTLSLFGASFDCTKATTKVEEMICANEELSKLDEKLSEVYTSFYYLTKEIKTDQRAWMKQRNTCQNTNCIKESYQTRIQELKTSLENSKTFPKLYLDAMKEAQENMQIVWNPIIFSEQKRIDAGLKFKDDLFRFKNITFKPPLIQNVQYDNPKLKEILGVCYYYRFDLKIEEFDNPKYISNGKKYWVEDERKPLRDINVSVWKTYAKDKEWLFIKPTTSGSAFLVDTALCKQERLKNNLVDALNYDRGRVKRSQSGLYNAAIISYKEQEYIFDTSWGRGSIIYFNLYKILSRTGPNDPMIRFTGGWKYLIPFEKTNKPQQGEK